MTVCVVVLSCLLVSLTLCLALRTPLGAWCLMVSSALWLPVNNKHLEGTVLFAIAENHGVTTSDLLGVAGFLVAFTTLMWRSRQNTSAGRRATPTATITYVSSVIFGLGAAAAYLRG